MAGAELQAAGGLQGVGGAQSVLDADRGGKFDDANYKTSGGLHGVGASVVNALSSELVATIKRDGAEWQMKFKQGNPAGKLQKLGAAKGHETAAQTGSRQVYFQRTGFVATPAHTRAALRPGDKFSGPALVDAPDTTIVVPPGWHATIDSFLNVVIER